MSKGKLFIAQREWAAIESRLRKLGAPESMFNADFDSQVEAAVQQFEAVQEQRAAEGLERTPLPDDPRVLIPGHSPSFLRPLRYSLREWIKQPRKDAKATAKRKAARESIAKVGSQEPKI
jgi:hypothetical protein